MAPLMTRTRVDRQTWWKVDPSRPLLIGVLPHASCNPKVRGCGFCTFPHEPFDREHVLRTASGVAAEIREAHALANRKVTAVYFGGGTANLTPPAAFADIVEALSLFDLSNAEITLEGVPRYFALHDGALLGAISTTGRARRISMGVQTFDPEWLRRMGRDAFGDRHEIEWVVKDAHDRGMTSSADLLVNLPGRVSTLDDIARCIGVGFDQICIYNLVLSPDLDVPWAHDRSLLDSMPDNEAAYAGWCDARAFLLERGFVQTTLTNFERAPAFAYERASFDPSTWDAVGFGPSAISTFSTRHHAVKWANDGTSFVYGPRDLRLLHVTRNIAAMRVDSESYERFFGTRFLDDFAPELEAVHRWKLMNERFELTGRGMFFADAVAGLFASAHVASLRGGEPNLTPGHMG